MRVLLVEDEPRAAQLLSKGLREQSYAVDVAPNGEDALYRAAITEYDVIVLDVMLPGSDGFEVCRELRRGGSHVPVLMLTATQVTLAKEIRSADEYRESLVIIGEQATRLSRLVDAMFLLSRAEAHGVPLQLEFVNLDDIVAESARGVRVLANQRGVVVTTDGAEEVGLTGDDTLLRQMVGNLLDNAIRHAQPNGQVAAVLERTDHRVTLRVTNDGPGIEPANQDRIFERFVRIGESGGTGLGLPIARWIAEAHGGSLRLDGSWPGSTTFVVTLPTDSRM